MFLPRRDERLNWLVRLVFENNRPSGICQKSGGVRRVFASKSRRYIRVSWDGKVFPRTIFMCILQTKVKSRGRYLECYFMYFLHKLIVFTGIILCVSKSRGWGVQALFHVFLHKQITVVQNSKGILEFNVFTGIILCDFCITGGHVQKLGRGSFFKHYPTCFFISKLVQKSRRILILRYLRVSFYVFSEISGACAKVGGYEFFQALFNVFSS